MCACVWTYMCTVVCALPIKDEPSNLAPTSPSCCRPPILFCVVFIAALFMTVCCSMVVVCCSRCNACCCSGRRLVDIICWKANCIFELAVRTSMAAPKVG